MCTDPLHPFLARLPKCEHHVHLEGCLTPTLLFALAAQNSIPLPTDTHPALSSPESLLDRYAAFSSLDDFLDYYYIGFRVLQRASDFEALAWDYLSRAAAAGVRHAEISIDPQAHTARGVSLATVLAGANAARSRASTELGLSTRLICCFLRHLPATDALATYETALPALRDGTLAGIGLDSSEASFPPELFGEVFARARRDGVRRTAHAGEELGPESVRVALRELDVQRVDHGRSIARDEGLMREVAERALLVTMCPLSNVRLKGVARVGDLPVRAFLDARVRFSVNSDDPAYFGGYALENYCALQQAFGLSVGEWEWIARGAIEGSWCEEERKVELKGLLEEVVREFG